MGQDLFEPPNVGGWPSGRTWIHARSMIIRANYAAALIAGRNVGRPAYDPAALPKKHGLGGDANAVLTFHHRLLFGTDPTGEVRRRLAGADGRIVVTRLLSAPEAQLG